MGAAAVLVSVSLAACGGAGGALQLPPPTMQPTPPPNLRIYVACGIDSTIRTFLADGTQTTPTINAGPISGVTVDAANKFYVSGLNMVTTYGADGTPTTPTIRGVPAAFAVGIAVDSTGKIYVANHSDKISNVSMYEADGNPALPTITGPYGFDGVAVH